MPGGYCYLLHPEQFVKAVSSCRFGATARGRALGMESSPPLAPSQGCEQETTTAETTERRHEARRWGRSLPLLLLPVRDASRRRRPQRRRSDSTRPGAWDGVTIMTIGTAGPEDETEGCTRSECAIRHERGHQE